MREVLSLPTMKQQRHHQSKSDTAGRRCAASLSGDWVILLHGLFATRGSMSKLESRLLSLGFNVLNCGYRTFWRSTEQHVQQLLKTLAALQDNPRVHSIHFVTHSMGGILARGALHYGSVDKVRRLVMLAPPNSGSQLTRFPLGPFAYCVPSIADLIETADSLPNRFKTPAHIEVGIIAAARDPIVPIANTILAGQRDHRIVPTTHFRLPRDETTLSMVACFLEHGLFSAPAASRQAA